MIAISCQLNEGQRHPRHEDCECENSLTVDFQCPYGHARHDIEGAVVREGTLRNKHIPERRSVRQRHRYQQGGGYHRKPEGERVEYHPTADRPER